MDQSLSWCENGHGLRVDLGATVLFIHAYSGTSFIQRNANGHPMTLSGVVEGILHKDQSVVIRYHSEEDTVTVCWDMVVAREDAELPLALLGTNDYDEFIQTDAGWCFRRTIDFKQMQELMPGMKVRYVERILNQGGLINEPISTRRGSLSAMSFQSFMDGVSQRAEGEHTSFFTAAMELVVLKKSQ